MKIVAQDKEIQELLKGTFFKIPRFQRAYSWETEEVEDFWNDIIENQDANYFIGSVVAYIIDNPMVGLVDGQQRFTTVTIILSAIREKFKELGEQELARGVQNYIEGQDADNKKQFILAPETSYPYFQREIQKYDPITVNHPSKDISFEENKIKDAYTLIKKLLNDYLEKFKLNKESSVYKETLIQKVKELRSKILKLKLVYILLDNEVDAYLIFETLNARGKELNVSDLVKNLLLKNLPNSHIDYDEAQALWQTLIDKLDTLKDKQDKTIVDQYLYHYWNATHSITTSKKLFPTIKDRLGEKPEDCENFLKHLVENSEYYLNILDPETIENNIKNKPLIYSLKTIQDLKIKIVYPLLLSLLIAYSKNKISTKLLRNFISTIEQFHFQFNGVCRRKTGGTLTTLYNETAQSIYKVNETSEANNIFIDFKKSLNKVAVTKEEFILNFEKLKYDNKNLKHKNVIKYSLFKILESIPTKPYSSELADLTIEHLISQSTKTSFMSNVGNLILVGSKLNNEKLKDLLLHEKIKILEDHNYPLIENFIQPLWDGSEEAINTRSKQLGEKIYNLTSI
ncbi:DUF262 domain-containing protein [Acinetobacter baumannii]|uniref:DUF262 domain-containing protein n=1 Tax=Acinetobacter baumannii TaxID=470 RepID=UPI000F7354F1|nr:DUF262 domain-containing protein [Acinetobacter baumannii]RSP97790.1 DUF262 domain-containing protein [Acinetobacter baumannii]